LTLFIDCQPLAFVRALLQTVMTLPETRLIMIQIHRQIALNRYGVSTLSSENKKAQLALLDGGFGDECGY
jgi:hypothetical protein